MTKKPVNKFYRLLHTQILWHTCPWRKADQWHWSSWEIRIRGTWGSRMSVVLAAAECTSLWNWSFLLLPPCSKLTQAQTFPAIIMKYHLEGLGGVDTYWDKHPHEATLGCFPQKSWNIEETSLKEENIENPLIIFVIHMISLFIIESCRYSRVDNITSLNSCPFRWYWEGSMNPAVGVHDPSRHFL